MTLKLSEEFKTHLKDWQHSYQKYYDNWPIRKRHGGVRWIHAPKAELRALQETLNLKLLKQEYHPAALAFLPGCNPQKTFMKHLGNLQESGWLLTLDIKDFYGHVTGKMLTDVGLTEEEMLITCIPHKKRGWVLPQGGITSPLAANLAAKQLDGTIHAWSNEHGLVYTRYADDLGFSGENDFRAVKPIKHIAAILQEFGFHLAADKIKMQPPGCGQMYLGLVFTSDGRLSISQKYRNRARAMHYNDRTKRTTNTRVVQGVLQYVKSVNEAQYLNLIIS
jgi:RNA-directed DNA polymerase